MSKAQRKNKEQVVTHQELKVAKKGKKEKVAEFVLTKEQEKELAAQTSVSAQIRYLDKEGMPRSQIATKLNKIYQHVRNVLETPLKRKSV